MAEFAYTADQVETLYRVCLAVFQFSTRYSLNCEYFGNFADVNVLVCFLGTLRFKNDFFSSSSVLNVFEFIYDYFISFSSSVPTIDVELSVTNVHPLSGSLQGGTRLTVTGVGFGNDSSVVEVDVGDVMCDIESVVDTEVICLIADSGEVHAVTNLGTHRGTSTLIVVIYLNFGTQISELSQNTINQLIFLASYFHVFVSINIFAAINLCRLQNLTMQNQCTGLRMAS